MAPKSLQCVWGGGRRGEPGRLPTPLPPPGAKNVNARHCVSPFRPASLSHLASTRQEVVPSQRPPDGAKRGVGPEPATPGGTCRLPVPRGGVAAKCSTVLKSEGGDPTRPGRPAPGGPAARTWPPPRPRRPPSRSLLVVALFSSRSPAAMTGCFWTPSPACFRSYFFC